MPHATPQFTPEQLLESGRHSEAEGKVELATQFYAHLVDSYPYAAETAEAREALARIGASGPVHALWQAEDWARARPPKPAALPSRRTGPVAPRDHYRAGSIIAACVSAVGWVAMLGGFGVFAAAAGAHVVPIGLLDHLKLGNGVLAQGSTAMLAGAAAVFLGQVARALFDQANATRELLAIERAKLSEKQLPQ